MIARSPRRSDHRRGSASLIEVIAAFGVMSVLFLTTATVISLLFRLDRLGRDELTATVAEGRLAAELRSDVRAATDLEFDPDGPADRLSLLDPSGPAASYRVEGDDLIRQGPDRLERYRLLPGTVARWEVAGDGPGRRVVLSLAVPKIPKKGGGEVSRRVVRIEATLGRDHRFNGNAS